jgi:hypothetical protein
VIGSAVVKLTSDVVCVVEEIDQIIRSHNPRHDDKKPKSKKTIKQNLLPPRHLQLPQQQHR